VWFGQRKDTAMTDTERLVDWIWSLRFGDLTSSVVDKSKELLLDHIGIAIRGSRSESSQAIQRYIRAQGFCSETCTIIGTGKAAHPPDAVLANGVAAHYIECDDVHNRSSTHPGAVVFPTALAVSQMTGTGEEEFVLAVASGYEIMGRVGAAANPEGLFRRHFHPTGPVGVLAASVVAARLLGLSDRKAVSALGIAADGASGSMQFLVDQGWTKHLHPAMAARNGLQAAMLAAHGYQGPRDAISGSRGFLAGYSAAPRQGLDLVGLETATPPTAIISTSVKPYANCRYIHPVLDALLAIMEAHVPFDVGSVESVEVSLPPVAYDIVGRLDPANRYPRTAERAQFSVHFAVAVALLTGDVTVDSYQGSTLSDPRVLRLIDRVTCRADEELGQAYPAHWGAGVKVRHGGQVYAKVIRDARGDPTNPLALSNLERKFHQLTTGVCPAVWADEVCRTIQQLPAPGTLSALHALLSSSH